MSERKMPRKIIRIVPSNECGTMTPERPSIGPSEAQQTSKVLAGKLQNVEFAMGDSTESVVQVQVIQLPTKQDDTVVLPKRETRGKKPHRYRDSGEVSVRKMEDNGERACETIVEVDTPGCGADVKPSSPKLENRVPGRANTNENEAIDDEVKIVSIEVAKRKRIPERDRTIEDKTCDICHQVFDTYRRRMDHAKNAHRVANCPHCDKTLYNKHALTKHIWSIHPELGKGEPPVYPCRFCGKEWGSNSSRFSHEQTHKQRSHECSVCKQLFHNAFTRKNHELTHSSQSVRCSFCKRLFENAESFANHLRRTHPAEVETHGAGIWNVANTRKAKLRGSKVEREIGVVIAGYLDEDEKRSEAFAGVEYSAEQGQSEIDLLIDGGGCSKTAKGKPHRQSGKQPSNHIQLTDLDQHIILSEEETLTLVKSDGMTIQKAVIKCQLCEASCFDGDAMIAHLLNDHSGVLQVKLIE